MSTFPIPVTSPQLVTIRTSGYWSRVLAALCPNEVVFMAQAAEAITGNPFITFTWENATVGAYGDVWEGMVVYISETTSIRDAKYRGRVRLAPSATDFYIDLNPTLLAEGDYILVTRDTDLFACVRNDTLIDSAIAYHDLPPQTSGLPACVVLYDADDDGEVTYTPPQDGIPVDAAATAISTWLWDVSGSGTSSIDDDEAQNPTITFEAGYHYLLRVQYEDDNNVSNYQIIHVYAITRTFSAPVVQPVVAGSIEGNVQDGWTASLTAYGDVSTLADRTHCAVFHVQHFGDHSSAPIISNVLMNGRIRSETIQTEGNAEAGQVQQAAFTVEGITAYLRRMRFPNDIVRATTTPDEWGEMRDPTPYRMAVYAAYAYSTLLHLGSFGVEEGAFAAYAIGDEPRGIEGGYAIDVLASLLDPIKAAANVSPAGELFLARTASYREDRDAIPLIAVLGLGDLPAYDLARDSGRTTSQVIAFGGSYNSTLNSFVLYTASAPSIVFGDGETRELTRELLTADATPSEAEEELSLRASNDYAANNPKPLLSLNLLDSWAGVMIPTNYQRWTAVLPAWSNVRGIAYTATDYWQLQSVTLTIGADGTIGVRVEMPAETSLDDAQVLSDLLPDNLTDMNPVLPVLPNEPAFPTDPLELYPTDLPALEELQAIDPYSAAQSYTPLTPDQAAQMARKQGQPGCKTLNVNFRWTTNVISSWTTVLSAPYLLTIEGSGEMNVSGDSFFYDFTVSKQGWEGLYIDDGQYAIYNAGVGWSRGTFNSRISIALDLAGYPITAVTLTFNTSFTGAVNIVDAAGIGGFGVVYNRSGSTWTISGLSMTDGVGVNIYDPDAGNTAPSGLRLVSITVTTSSGVIPLFADAFYQFELNEDGTPTNVSLLDDGLYLDNSKYMPSPFPDFRADHRYTGNPFVGTGNQLQARTILPNNAGAANRYLLLTLCPQG